MDEVSNLIKTLMKKHNINVYGVIDCPDFSFCTKRIESKKMSGQLTLFEEKMFTVSNNTYLADRNINSVIVIAFPYYSGKIGNNNREYKISKYAQIPDYHNVIGNILKHMIHELKTLFPDETFYPACDSSPIYEKECAVKAGIGSYGKNSLVYNDIYGSYFFLGEILSTKRLPQIKCITQKHCGTCNLCIDTCPAFALSHDGINSRKCISYLTQIKSDTKETLHSWLWGCDICQDICPRNIEVIAQPYEGFDPIDTFPTLTELNTMTNKEIKEVFSPTPVGWSGAGVVRQNGQVITLEKKATK